MFWYVAPFVEIDGSYTLAANGAPFFGSFVAHACDPREAPTSALVGVPVALDPVPDDWTPKTLDEARAHFEAVCGRAARDVEVF